MNQYSSHSLTVTDWTCHVLNVHHNVNDFSTHTGLGMDADIFCRFGWYSGPSSGSRQGLYYVSIHRPCCGSRQVVPPTDNTASPMHSIQRIRPSELSCSCSSPGWSPLCSGPCLAGKAGQQRWRKLKPLRRTEGQLSDVRRDSRLVITLFRTFFSSLAVISMSCRMKFRVIDLH